MPNLACGYCHVCLWACCFRTVVVLPGKLVFSEASMRGEVSSVYGPCTAGPPPQPPETEEGPWKNPAKPCSFYWGGNTARPEDALCCLCQLETHLAFAVFPRAKNDSFFHSGLTNRNICKKKKKLGKWMNLVLLLFFTQILCLVIPK